MVLRVYAYEPDRAGYLLVNEHKPANEGRIPGFTPVRVLDARLGILRKPVPLGSVLTRNFHHQMNEADAPDAVTLFNGDIEVRGPPADEIGEPHPSMVGGRRNATPDER